MKNKKILLIIICLLFTSCLVSCANNKSDYEVSNNSSTNDLENNYGTIKEHMDIGMKNAGKHEVIAKVNDIEITQTNKDVYLISDEKISTKELVKRVIIADYCKKNGLQIESVMQEHIDKREKEIREDETLTEEYCQKAYGISKEEVIAYMTNRSYEIWYDLAFSDMVRGEVLSGETVKKYPELKSAYEDFEKSKGSNPSKALDDIKNAYYEMIAKDYDVVIYKK